MDIDIIDGHVENISLNQFHKKLQGVDSVAISIHSSFEARDCEENIRFIKKQYPKIKIIMGGYHASFFYKRWLAIGVDFVVLYEGDECFKELMVCLQEGKSYACIKNLAFKEKDKVVVNEIRPLIENLDSLPVPRYDLIDFTRYFAFFPGDGFAGGIEISRGCPDRCDFCLTSKYWNERYRRKSNERILKELEMLHEKNIRKLWFYTSSFGIDFKKDYELCDLIIKRRLNISWRTSIRVDTVLKFPELIKKAAESGLMLVLIGYESVAQSVLLSNKMRNSLYSFVNYKKAYRLLKKNRIVVDGSFIVGLSDAADEMGNLSCRKLSQICDHLILQICRPNIATVHDILEKKPSDDDYKKLFYFYPNISHDVKIKKSMSIKRKIEYNYYLNPVYIYRKFFFSGRLVRRLCFYEYRYLIKGFLKYITRKCIDLFIES